MAERETRAEAIEASGEAAYWLDEIKEASKHEQEWREKRAPEVIERYRDEKRNSGENVNILWSNTETTKAAALARLPKPDVRRRFGDKDPVARIASTALERGLEYCADAYDAWSPVSAGVDDMLLPGRGVVRVMYEAKTASVGEGEAAYSAVSSQKVQFKYIPWADYRQQAARCWQEVEWVAFRHLLTRDELKKQFPEVGEKVPLAYSVRGERGDKGNEDGQNSRYRRAEVWEVWDSIDRRRLYVCEGMSDPLLEEKDPLRLEGFWPLPKPLLAVATTDSQIPIPLFTLYQDQARELDRVSQRITALVEALKRRGVRDATFKELEQLAKAGDNQFIPVERYAQLQEKGGLKAVFETELMEPTIKALAQLYAQRQQIVQTIYEITGLSDIIRGSSDPRETLGAQKLKGQFGGMRLKKVQDEIQRWIRDLYRLKAEIIAEHFEPQQLAEISGLQLPPVGQPNEQGQMIPGWAEVMGVLRSDKLRGYKVDVETDTTVFEDAEEEKKSRIEFLTAITTFGEKWAPLMQMSPALAKFGGEALGFVARGFKAGRQLEESLEEAMGELVKQAQQPKPDPEQQKMQAQLQFEQQKLVMQGEAKKAEMAMKAQDQQAQLQMDQQRQQMEMAAEAAKARQEMEIARVKAAQDLQLAQQKAAMDAQIAGQKAQQDAQVTRQKAAVDHGIAQQKAAPTQGDKLLARTAELQMQAAQAQMQAAEKMASAAEKMAAPKRVKRDAAGRVESVETMMGN